MSVRTHNSAWRTLVVVAPLLGVVFIVVAALQGERDVMRSVGVHQGLSMVAAIGAVVAGWTARRLAAIPSLPVAQAEPGTVALRGVAQPLPGDPPLISPNGDPLHVVGRFVLPSAEAIELQAAAAALVQREFVLRVVIRSRDGEAAFRSAIESARMAGPPPLPQPPVAGAPLALPVLAAPAGAEPFTISIGPVMAKAVCTPSSPCSTGWCWPARARRCGG